MNNADAVLLGSFDIGAENVLLYATTSAGGEFITNPAPSMWIGVGGDWDLTYQTLLHEAAEFAALRLGARFTPDDDMSADCGAFLFMMDHAKFSNLCGRVGRFMISANPYLRKAWESFHNPRNKGKLTAKLNMSADSPRGR